VGAILAQVIAPFEHQISAERCSNDLVTGCARSQGVGQTGAEVIIAETEGDMSRFGSSDRLASWAGMCPGNNEVGGQAPLRQDQEGFEVAEGRLTEAAKAASRSKRTYLSAQYKRLRGRRGPAKATSLWATPSW
jgi:transposase